MKTQQARAADPAPTPAASKQTYEEWKDEQILIGLQDLDGGRVVPHDEVVKSGEALIERLKRKHGEAA